MWESQGRDRLGSPVASQASLLFWQEIVLIDQMLFLAFLLTNQTKLKQNLNGRQKTLFYTLVICL